MGFIRRFLRDRSHGRDAVNPPQDFLTAKDFDTQVQF
jgi:hypothetical protein